MSGSSQLANLMPRRYEELEAVLLSHGFDVAWNTHPERPNEWKDDPPLGLVRVKGVWLPNADTEDDPDEDSRVTFSMTERWSEHSVAYEVEEREGLWLAYYSYNGHIAGPYGGGERCNHRHDFDTEKEGEFVFHLHPLKQEKRDRRPEDPVTPEQAIEDFLEVLHNEIDLGTFVL